MTVQDLANHESTVTEPIKYTYAGEYTLWEVSIAALCGMPPPRAELASVPSKRAGFDGAYPGHATSRRKNQTTVVNGAQLGRIPPCAYRKPEVCQC